MGVWGEPVSRFLENGGMCITFQMRAVGKNFSIYEGSSPDNKRK
jgi:hypothetical protein